MAAKRCIETLVLVFDGLRDPLSVKVGIHENCNIHIGIGFAVRTF